jgi:hypothetical protein
MHGFYVAKITDGYKVVSRIFVAQSKNIPTNATKTKEAYS